MFTPAAHGMRQRADEESEGDTVQRKEKKSGRAAAVTAVSGGLLLFASAGCYVFLVGRNWLYASSSVAVSAGGADVLFFSSVLTALLYLLPPAAVITAGLLAILGGKRRRRTPVFWSIALLILAAIVYKLIPPNALAVSYYLIYRQFPVLRELAARGITLFILFYLLGLALLAVFLGICPLHKPRAAEVANGGVNDHEA